MAQNELVTKNTKIEKTKKRVELPVPEHFTKAGYNLNDMMVAVLRSDLADQAKRRREEMRLIFNYKTLAPSGLNQDFSFT